MYKNQIILCEILNMLKLSISINSGISAYRFSYIAMHGKNITIHYA